MAAVHADIPIRLQPRARRSEVVGERAGAVVVPPSRVQVVRGQTARDKVVRVDGAEEAAVRAALQAWS